MRLSAIIASSAALLLASPVAAEAASCSHITVRVKRFAVTRDNFISSVWVVQSDYRTTYISLFVTDDKGNQVLADEADEVDQRMYEEEISDQLPDYTKRGKRYAAHVRVSNGRGCTTDRVVKFKTR